MKMSAFLITQEYAYRRIPILHHLWSNYTGNRRRMLRYTFPPQQFSPSPFCLSLLLIAWYGVLYDEVLGHWPTWLPIITLLAKKWLFIYPWHLEYEMLLLMRARAHTQCAKVEKKCKITFKVHKVYKIKIHFWLFFLEGKGSLFWLLFALFFHF